MVDDLDLETARIHIQALADNFLDDVAAQLAYAARQPFEFNLKDPNTNQPLNPLETKRERDMAQAYQKVLVDAASQLREAIKKTESAPQLKTELKKFCDNLKQNLNYIEDLIEKGALEEPNTLIPSTEIKKASQSTLYATRTIEPRPNHAVVSDLLAVLPYPHKRADAGITLTFAHIVHSEERFVQYELFGMDSTGDFIPITDASAPDIVGGFDWIDHKILSALLMRSIENDGNKFILSLNWLADLITDDRNRHPSNGAGKRKYFRRKELLQELERRIKRLRMLFLQVKWHEGEGKNKKIFNLLRQEGIKEIEFALFLVPMMWKESKGRKQDILAEIEPGRWYQIYCKQLRQFTWIPKEVFGINTYKHWRRYAIADYVLIHYRACLNSLSETLDPETHQPSKVLHRTLKTLITEVLSPQEIDYALNDPDKGWRLKTGILEDFEWLRSLGWYVDLQFPKGGFSEFMQGIVDIAPAPNNAQAIQKALDSRPEAKKRSSRRKPLATGELTGKQVEQARKRKKYSRQDLANLINISADYLGKLERDDRPITPELEINLRKQLGL